MNKILRRERGTLHPSPTSLITLIKAGFREGTLQHPPEIMVAAEHREHGNCELFRICVPPFGGTGDSKTDEPQSGVCVTQTSIHRPLGVMVQWWSGHHLRVCVSVCITT